MRTIIIVSILTLILLLPTYPLDAQADAGIQATIAVAEVNIRREPSLNREWVGTLTQGVVVSVHGKEDLHGNGGVWVYITTDNLAGWVLSDYLQFPSDVVASALPTTYGPRAEGYTLVGQATERDDLHLYTASNADSTVLAIIPRSSLLGFELSADPATAAWGYLQRENGFIYVTWLEGGITGWVESRRIYYPARLRNLPPGSQPHPLQAEYSTDGAIPVQGQVVGYIRPLVVTVQLRDYPSYDGAIITRTPPNYRVWLMVHGRNDSEPQQGWIDPLYNTAWLYVTTLGEHPVSGWVKRSLVNLPGAFDMRYLPILDAVAQPTLPPPVAPLSAVEVTTNARVFVFNQPVYTYAEWRPRLILPAGTALTVTGIDLETGSYQITVEGEIGWINPRGVYAGGDYQPPLTIVTREWFRLPIVK